MKIIPNPRETQILVKIFKNASFQYGFVDAKNRTSMFEYVFLGQFMQQKNMQKIIQELEEKECIECKKEDIASEMYTHVKLTQKGYNIAIKKFHESYNQTGKNCVLEAIENRQRLNYAV